MKKKILDDLFDDAKVNQIKNEWNSLGDEMMKNFPVIRYFNDSTPTSIKRDVLEKLALFGMMENKETNESKVEAA